MRRSPTARRSRRPSCPTRRRSRAPYARSSDPRRSRRSPGSVAADPPTAPPPAALDGAAALRVLETMWRIRHFEERVGRLKRADEVHGLIHLSVGQEGVAAGVCPQLRDDDAVYSGHRAHGHAIATGAPLDRTMAELMGRADGLCRGLGGSMHLVDVASGFMGATGVVGGNLPIALGSALAARRRGSDAGAVALFGVGALQAGHFTETVNLATLWALPLILVCENNGFAEFTPRSAHTTVERVSDVVAPYRLGRGTVEGKDAAVRAGGAPSGLGPEPVDGNDVVAVHAAFGRFVGAARAGGGPALLECLTHRLRGHYEGDPAKYREALAADEWQAKAPVVRLTARGVEAGWFSTDDAAAAERDAEAEVEAAVAFPRASPLPEPGLAEELVYA